ncbi:MAG: hypothetical protein P0121_16030 [Nitrospira sp.]|nr:hypothetical protein [Nitrospira sp.]
MAIGGVLVLDACDHGTPPTNTEDLDLLRAVEAAHLPTNIIRSRLLLLRKGGELDFSGHQFAIFLRDIYRNSVAYPGNVPSTPSSFIPIFCLGDCGD